MLKRMIFHLVILIVMIPLAFIVVGLPLSIFNPVMGSGMVGVGLWIFEAMRNAYLGYWWFTMPVTALVVWIWRRNMN